MTLEQICVSKEWAEKLKEAGFEQESLLKYCGGHTYYQDNDDGVFEACPYDGILDEDEYCAGAGMTCEFFIAAPTASEILEKLPEAIEYQVDKNEPGTRDYEIRISVDINGDYLIMYSDFTANRLLWGISDKSLSNALAKMYCYLESKNLIKVKD